MKLIATAQLEPPVLTPDGAQRRVLAYGGKLMLVHVTYESGVTSAAHSHPHEQVSYVVSGEIDFYMDGQPPVRMASGASFYVPPDVRHYIITYAPSVLVDAFTPQRADFMPREES